jgi:hypothetical protein
LVWLEIGLDVSGDSERVLMMGIMVVRWEDVEQPLPNKINKQAASLIRQRELLYISVAAIYVLKIDMIGTDHRLASAR